jgi:hypothetical protein
LTADGVQGEEETVIAHGSDFGLKAGRCTMSCQRTVGSVLTGCLTPGAQSIMATTSIFQKCLIYPRLGSTKALKFNCA